MASRASGSPPKGNFSFLGVHNLGITTEDFQGRPDAREDKIGTANAFFLETVHPVGDSFRQFAENLAPVADRGIVGTGPTDQVDARGQSGRIAGARRLPISVAIGHEPVIVQPPWIRPESKASQPSVVL